MTIQTVRCKSCGKNLGTKLIGRDVELATILCDGCFVEMRVKRK